MTELTDTGREVLDFADLRWKFAGAKEAAVRDQFDMTLPRYHQVLNALLDRPEALAYAPALVNRLRRLRTERRRERSGRLTA